MKSVLLLLAISAAASAQTPLAGVIDIHVHSDPDSVPRSIDAIDLARLAKARGMRGLVLKNHYESTAALAYVVRKEVPGIEIFGGIDLNRSVGGVNPAAIERMVLMKGGWGRVVWMPTFDAENQVRYSKEDRPFVSVSKNGRLLPEAIQVIALAAKHGLTLETGHSSAEEGLMLVREARRQGVQHVVVTHAMLAPVKMTVPQMREAAAQGAYLEFVYTPDVREYADAIRQVGPASCILSSDLGQVGKPLHPDGLAAFFAALRREGISQADIDLMSKTNPARVLGLPEIGDPAPPLQEEIVARERAELDSLKTGDMAAFANLLADDAVFVDAAGAADKAEVVKNTSGFRLHEYTMTDVKFVALSAESGLIAYRLAESGTSHGKEFTAKVYVSAFWVRRGGRWVCVFSQETAAK